MEKIKHLGKIPTTCDHFDQSEVQDFIIRDFPFSRRAVFRVMSINRLSPCYFSFDQNSTPSHTIYI
jgi:hypothetical protein